MESNPISSTNSLLSLNPSTVSSFPRSLFTDRLTTTRNNFNKQHFSKPKEPQLCDGKLSRCCVDATVRFVVLALSLRTVYMDVRGDHVYFVFPTAWICRTHSVGSNFCGNLRDVWMSRTHSVGCNFFSNGCNERHWIVWTPCLCNVVHLCGHNEL